MGAHIERTAVLRSRRWLGHRSRRLADAAARVCLRAAKSTPRDVDLLINVGVYHDRNLGEPALAALIQEDIAANPRLEAGRDHGTFSFDVSNGGAGIVSAFHLMDGFLHSSIQRGLVVASDAHPGTPVTPAFPFPPVGGAALLVRGEDDARGFLGFHFETFPEHASLFSAHIEWLAADGHHPHNALVIETQPEYRACLVACTARAVHHFLDRARLSLSEIDLVIASQYPPRFGLELMAALGLHPDGLGRAAEDFAGAHTAGPLAALSQAERDGRLAGSRLVLFATAGAGISVGLALYRP